MSHALAARAASIGASLLVMTGLLMAALTMTYAIKDVDWWTPSPPIEMAVPEPPPPNPTPPSQPQAHTEPLGLAPIAPIEPINTTAETGPAVAPLAPATPVEITSPHWQRRPSNLSRYYPERARARNIEGEALLDCLVRVSGLLDCTVVSESPRGWGFAEAALRIADAHRMVPATRGGVAVEGRYVMRVPFAIE